MRALSGVRFCSHSRSSSICALSTLEVLRTRGEVSVAILAQVILLSSLNPGSIILPNRSNAKAPSSAAWKSFA
ncbi:hypothetical protein FOZ62_009754 [Perkinsus olseni]|uniref:Uncharacterized protein n=1 Tax=Perkinsus olseni TaxID=32597 RepID=A0A7J6U857_PEROL|nr:hypothetical protein FOZ62_009754 [Perkinsus olseni]